jgi:hypothetical protein
VFTGDMEIGGHIDCRCPPCPKFGIHGLLGTGADPHSNTGTVALMGLIALAFCVGLTQTFNRRVAKSLLARCCRSTQSAFSLEAGCQLKR